MGDRLKRELRLRRSPQFCIQKSCSAYKNLAVDSVYNYMVQNPAVYSSYGYGYYKMSALRDKYQGSDLEFHTAVLSVGPTTYEILEKHVLGKVEEKGNGTIWDIFF